MKKILCTVFAIALSTFVFAENITFHGIDGDVTVSIPDDIAWIIKDNMSEIEKALEDNGITKAQITSAAEVATTEYNNYVENSNNIAPVSEGKDGIDNFCEKLADTLPNAQLAEAVWGQAWIGYLFPGIHFGAGFNVSVSTLNVKGIKDMADAFGVGGEIKDLPDTLVFPVITTDFRLGGFKLGDFKIPLDLGFNVFKTDTSSLGLDETLKGIDIDYFNIGFDVRYALLEGKGLLPRFSVGAGFGITKGSVGVNQDEVDAEMNFQSTTFYLSSQVSKKLMFFVPFAGMKLGFSNSSVDYNAKLNWYNILDVDESDDMAVAVTNGLLPKDIGDEINSFVFTPQIFGGFALDLFVVDLTFSAGYDFAHQNAAGAFSVRLSWQ